MRSHDWNKAVACLTQQSQEEITAGFLAAGMMMMDEEKAPAVQAILEKHGVDIEELGKKFPKEFPIKDKPTFIVDMVALVPDLSVPPEGTLANVDIDGDTAKGVVKTPLYGEERSIEFRKIEGRWYVHMPEEGQLRTGIGAAGPAVAEGLVKGIKDWPTSPELLLTIRGRSVVRSVAFSPDGAILASASDEGFGTVRLWRVSRMVACSALCRDTRA